MYFTFKFFYYIKKLFYARRFFNVDEKCIFYKHGRAGPHLLVFHGKITKNTNVQEAISWAPGLQLGK